MPMAAVLVVGITAEWPGNESGKVSKTGQGKEESCEESPGSEEGNEC